VRNVCQQAARAAFPNVAAYHRRLDPPQEATRLLVSYRR